MDGVLDFSIGLTEGVAWPWPIAVYLFLAGISGGSLGVILTMMKLGGFRATNRSSKHQRQSRWQRFSSACSAWCSI